MRTWPASSQLPEPTSDDMERIGKLLLQIGGKNVVWGAAQSLDIWVIEQRSKLDQQMSKRLQTASWALVWATMALVLCTGGLIWATLAI